MRTEAQIKKLLAETKKDRKLYKLQLDKYDTPEAAKVSWQAIAACDQTIMVLDWVLSDK